MKQRLARESRDGSTSSSGAHAVRWLDRNRKQTGIDELFLLADVQSTTEFGCRRRFVTAIKFAGRAQSTGRSCLQRQRGGTARYHQPR